MCLPTGEGTACIHVCKHAHQLLEEGLGPKNTTTNGCLDNYLLTVLAPKEDESTH